jgi:hypothetical protein
MKLPQYHIIAFSSDEARKKTGHDRSMFWSAYTKREALKMARKLCRTKNFTVVDVLKMVYRVTP